MCRAGGWAAELVCMILIFGHCVITITFFGSAKVFRGRTSRNAKQKPVWTAFARSRLENHNSFLYATIVWVFLIAQLAHKKNRNHTQREIQKGRERHNSSSSSRILHIIRFSALPCNDGETPKRRQILQRVHFMNWDVWHDKNHQRHRNRSLGWRREWWRGTAGCFIEYSVPNSFNTYQQQQTFLYKGTRNIFQQQQHGENTIILLHTTTNATHKFRKRFSKVRD